MKPFADFPYFELLLYVAIPAIVLGVFGRANARLALISTLAFLGLQFYGSIEVRPHFYVRELWIALGYAVFQFALAATFLRVKFRGVFPVALGLSILPLAVAKYLPLVSPQSAFGFFGISYVTFRALDVVFSIKDGVIKAVPPVTYFAYLFFFPTVSSGPIDRFRRFSQDWQRKRSSEEFLDDLDFAVERLFRGFLYKFIIAALIDKYFVHPWETGGAEHVLGYMYAYTFYLFFDFAGYSSFAISVSYLLGIRTPENFNKPFLAPNIRDFWNRWHISLSFWFRDHVYMRFLLAAAKGKWFKNKHTASYLGLFLTFGLMGLWHGVEWYYLLYGLYHAALLSAYDWFARWNKTRNYLSGHPAWHWVNIALTFHAIAFGLLLFSGRLAARPLPEREEIVEKLDCFEISGYIWNRNQPNTPAQVDISMDGHVIGHVVADEFRQDLLDRGMGNGKYGFHLVLPPNVRDGNLHWVIPVVVGVQPPRMVTGPDIATPYEITCHTGAATPAPGETSSPKDGAADSKRASAATPLLGGH